ncbi:hypothetical protein DH09_11645 [Bacillaceae bacterium JMAK1]|nr:hypothetical protein DH09_11645 [Bacillaceae bacterium JMAK1]
MHCIIEYNENGYLIYAVNYPGAYARGSTKDEALQKMPREIQAYCLWAYNDNSKQGTSIESVQVQEQKVNVNVRDADTSILFDRERASISEDEYSKLKMLVLKSAWDFRKLYHSIPDKNFTNRQQRKTFYGWVPLSASDVLIHTNNVTSYYVGEIGVTIKNSKDIYENRVSALKDIEAMPNYLQNKVFKGSYDELWTLRKVMRRFIWHDRIHAKSMYRMANSRWGETIENPFCF